FDARNFCHCVRAISRLKWSREQKFFLHGLGCVLGVDTTRPEEEKPFHAGAVSLVDRVSLKEQILIDKLRRIGGISENAADFGRCQKNVLGTLACKEFPNLVLIG